MMARNGAKELGLMRVISRDSPSRAFSESTHAVAVVPRLAPMSSPIACPSSMIFELTRPTERTVIADADCTAAVSPAPKRKAKKRFFVIVPITFSSRPPVSLEREPLMVSIPKRKSARPPSIDATTINISIDVINNLPAVSEVYYTHSDFSPQALFAFIIKNDFFQKVLEFPNVFMYNSRCLRHRAIAKR